MRRLFRRFLVALLAAAGLALAWLLAVWPPPSWWRSHWPAETAFMRLREARYAAREEEIPRLYRPVPLDSISDWLERAATVGEDDAFYSHHGIDFRALREALGYRRTAFSWSDPGDRAELARVLARAPARRDALRGASTITQQLARNLYLSPSRNPLRKLKEAVIAWRLELALSKERILELYLNVVELGPNTWGVEEASRRYFGRGASGVSVEQAALLVATLPHPLSSNPGHRPSRARRRQQLILRRLRGDNVTVPREEAEPFGPALPLVPDSLALPQPPESLVVPQGPLPTPGRGGP